MGHNTNVLSLKHLDGFHKCIGSLQIVKETRGWADSCLLLNKLLFIKLLLLWNLKQIC
jgi:hypothetical protein